MGVLKLRDDQWEDGHESVFTPGSDAVIRHVERPGDDEPVLVPEP